MTKPNSAEIIFILDRSGSMAAIREDMIGGFNQLISDQKKEPGTCLVTLAQFDEHQEFVYIAKPIADVPLAELIPRGSTALLDAIGLTVTKTGERLAAMAEEDRPSRVIVVTITDGHENASREWSASEVKDLVTTQREKYQWEFMFLGASEDSIRTAQSYGFAAGRGAVFDANVAAKGYGAQGMYDAVSKQVSNSRGGRQNPSLQAEVRNSTSAKKPK